MCVAPTLVALTEGTTGLMTLIFRRTSGAMTATKLLATSPASKRTRVVGYNFDLRTNELKAEREPNPKKGTQHRFVAYRLTASMSVMMRVRNSRKDRRSKKRWA